MMVGHTKFAPDWCFGLVKQRFKRTKVGCLTDLETVVNNSAVVNHAQLVGREDGSILVPQYDWAEFFAPYFKRSAFDGIKSFHHLEFSSEKPCVVETRTSSDSKPQTVNILAKDHASWRPRAHDLPPQLHPPGLSRERRQYLFKKIREFCPEYSKDIVCPSPNSALINEPSSPPCLSRTPHPPQPSATLSPPVTPPPPQAKRRRWKK